MAELGKINKLKVLKELSFGIYLDGENLGEILMPKRYVPANCNINDEIDAFIYFDSEDRIIATTETPKVLVGGFALLKVVSVNAVGAFLDWGLSKDLLVPFREQKITMQEGQWHIVYVYVDYESRRIVASAKVDKHLDNLPHAYEPLQQVDLLIYSQTEIGYKAIINNQHWGILYNNEVFQPLRRGQLIKGYIKKVREDEKIDLSLYKTGYVKIEGIANTILSKLNENDGFIEVTDKSPAKNIYELFGISKKAYKQAIGSLYKQEIITIETYGIRLNVQE
jgi:predicted RNA-binding protein (virulence factor B family)